MSHVWKPGCWCWTLRPYTAWSHMNLPTHSGHLQRPMLGALTIWGYTVGNPGKGLLGCSAETLELSPWGDSSPSLPLLLSYVSESRLFCCLAFPHYFLLAFLPVCFFVFKLFSAHTLTHICILNAAFNVWHILMYVAMRTLSGVKRQHRIFKNESLK